MTFIPLGDGTTFIAVDRWGAPPECRADGGGDSRFRPGTIAARLLSHAHADHTAGLDDAWARDGARSAIYASPATAAFLSHKWPALTARAFKPLVPGDELRLFAVGGGKRGRGEDGRARTLLASVHVLDANHCPGSLMFLISLPGGGAYLHTGDCRFESEALRGLVGRAPLAGVLGASGHALGPPAGPAPGGLSFLFLDATYGARASLQFPARAAVAGAVLGAARAGPAGLGAALRGEAGEGGGGATSARGTHRRGRPAGAAAAATIAPRWAEVAVSMDAIGREELLAALAAALGVAARCGRARVAAAVAAGLPGGLFQVDEEAEAGAGPMASEQRGHGGGADAPPLLRVLSRRRVGAFVRACGGRGVEEEEGVGGGAAPPPQGPSTAGPTLLILPSSLHLIKAGYWCGRLAGLRRVDVASPGGDKSASPPLSLSLVAVDGAPDLVILEAPYSLHAPFAEVAALAAALRPVGVVATGSDAEAVRRAVRRGDEGALEKGMRPLADAVAGGMGLEQGQGPGVSVGGDWGWVGGARWLY